MFFSSLVLSSAYKASCLQDESRDEDDDGDEVADWPNRGPGSRFAPSLRAMGKKEKEKELRGANEEVGGGSQVL